MFNNLPLNSAIKFGEVFIVNLPNNYGTTYLVDGVRITGGIHTLPNVNNIKLVVPPVKEVSHYELPDGTQVSVELYTSSSLSNYYDCDCDDYVFDSLEHEYAAKKAWQEVSLAKAIWEESAEVLEDVTVAIVGEAVDTGSEFIETPYRYGETSFDNSTGVFKVNVYSVAVDEFKAVTNKYPKVSTEIPSHSGLEYAKVNGNYLFTGSNLASHITGRRAVRLFTTLQQAQDEEQSIRKKIRDRVLIEILGAGKQLDGITVKQLHSILSNTLARVRSLEVKQKSSSSKQALINTLNKSLESIPELLGEDK